MGYRQYAFGFRYCPYNDSRLGDNISFYMKDYLIKDVLNVSSSGLEESKEGFNNEKILTVENQSLIFIKLLSKHFDLFGLIESGLAIDKTTIAA